MRDRKIIFIGMILFLLFWGCSEDGKIAKMEEENKAIVRHIHEEVSKGNMAVFNDVLSTDYVRHCQAMPPEL